MITNTNINNLTSIKIDTNTCIINQQQNRQYCYWDVRSQTDFIFIAFIIVIQVMYAFYRSVKYLKASAQRYIYYFLFAWYVAYSVQYSYGVANYQYIQDNMSERPIVVQLSVKFQFMDFIPAFLLMACLYFVGYQLLKRIHTLSTKQGYHLTKIQLYFYQTLKYYQFFRILYIIPTAALLFFNGGDQDQYDKINTCSTVQLVLFLIDSILCNITLLISIRTLRKKNQLLGISNEESRKKLLRQSILLQFAGIMRFIMGLIFIFLGNLSIFTKCPCQSNLRTVFYIIFGQIVMHFMPVMVILSIFRVSRRQIDQLKSRGSREVSDLQTQLDIDTLEPNN